MEIFKTNRTFQSVESLLNFKNYEKLQEVTFLKPINEDLESLLPRSIETLHFKSKITSCIPSWVKNVSFITEYEQSIFSNSNVTSLDLTGIQFPCYIPSSVTHLTLRSMGGLRQFEFAEPTLISKGQLPCLQVINLENSNFKFEQGALSDSLIELHASGRDCPITLEQGILPESLKVLNLSYMVFDYKVGDKYFSSDFKFPSQLVELQINFVDSLSIVLPSTLKKLTIGAISINDACLPKGLEDLHICRNLARGYFHVELNENNLPRSIKSLKIYWCTKLTDKQGKVFLPNTLENLEICGGFEQQLLPNQLPKNLKDISITTINAGFPIDNKDIFPSGLVNLALRGKFNNKINNLPESLKTLRLDWDFDSLISENCLPKGLELLEIRKHGYQHPIKSSNQNTLIIVDNYYSQEGLESVRRIQTPEPQNFPLARYNLTNKCELEYLGYNSSIEITQDALPTNNNIKILSVLSNNYNYSINLEWFPKLETLIINGNSYPTLIGSSTLKSIETSIDNVQFIDSLNESYYPILKLSKPIKKNGLFLQ